jgi:putative hydrolase of the HAD superfamily
MLRAVGFDLWETLITNTPELSRQQKDLRVARLGRLLGMEGAELEAAYRSQWQRCHELYWSADRDISCRRQIEHLLELLQRQVPEALLAELEEAYATVAVDVPPAVVSGAHELLTALKSRGLRVGLISNTGRTPGYALRRVLEQVRLADSIDTMVFSNEHGLCKPERSIFDEMRRGLGVGFEEMAFVGDNLYVDILGAKRVGMRAVHFQPPRRGTAVAPPVEHEEVLPDAAVERLEDVLPLIDSWR